MLIRLTGIPHPDLNGGNAQPIYIDASRVLLILGGYVTLPKLGSMEAHKELYDKLFIASRQLADAANSYMPDMTDPTAVGWMRTIQMTAGDVNSAYKAWGSSYNQNDFYPRIDCTEIQLACGTALEHGVMLTRVWVSESPEEVCEVVTLGPVFELRS